MTKAEYKKRDKAIIRMREQGVSVVKIAKAFGVSSKRIYQIIGRPIDEACIDCLYFENNRCTYGKVCDFKDEFKSQVR